MSDLPVAAQQAYISIQAYLGPPDYSHITAIDYVSPTIQTAAVMDALEISIPGSTSYQAVALGTLLAALSAGVFLSLSDITSPNQSFGVSTVNGSGGVTIAPGGFWAYMPNGGAFPTLYLSNPNSGAGLVRIAVMSL
jgi:hypothetical protein